MNAKQILLRVFSGILALVCVLCLVLSGIGTKQALDCRSYWEEEGEKAKEGFDALEERYVKMVDAGILDPVKVTRSALQNATSVASTFLTTEAAVADIKEPAPAMPAGAGAPGGMMM